MGTTNKSLERFLGISPKMRKRERGQILVLVALLMVGLLVASGIAVDVGFLLMRKSQFDRAVDAAALTGVTVVSATDASSITTANYRGRQLLGANGIPITDARTVDYCNADGSLPVDNPATVGVDESRDYCGQRMNGLMPGSVRYRAVARWWVPTFFMRLININSIPLVSDATAEYYNIVDMYASDTTEQGLVRSAVLGEFGPQSCTGNGDAYSSTVRGDTGPASPWYNELNGAYTFRISIPDDASFPYDKVRIEIFDPDSFNMSSNSVTYYNVNGSGTGTTVTCPDTNRAQPCIVTTADTATNPYWFQRSDEVRGTGAAHSCGGTAWDTNVTNRTLYRLYYYKQVNPGTLAEVDLAYYVSPKADVAEAQATDLKWVVPGAPCTGSATTNECSPGTSAVGAPNVMPATTGEVATTANAGTCTAWVGQQFIPGGARSTATTCVGNGDFIVQIKDGPSGTSEVPGLYVDPNGNGRRDLFLQVIALDGATENGYNLWAGPAYTASPNPGAVERQAPANVNARQLTLNRNRTLHRSEGVGVFAMGHMEMNWLAASRVRFPLAYLGPSFSGQTLNVNLYDAREAESGSSGAGSGANGASPLYFYFDTISTKDWSACFAHSQNDCTNDDPGNPDNPRYPDSPDWTWHDCVMPADPTGGNNGPGPLAAADTQAGDCLGYSVGGAHDHPDMQDLWGILSFKIPTERDEILAQQIPFYGGRLFVSYSGRSNESNTWKMTVDARPVLVG